MIRQLIRAVDWRAMLVPVGAALLSAGADHLERRRDAAAAELGQLDALVEHRRAQLDGRRPLDEDHAASTPADAERDADSSTSADGPRVPVGVGLAAIVGLGVLGLVGLVLGRRAVTEQHGALVDDGDVYADEVPDPWTYAQPARDPECPCGCGLPLDVARVTPAAHVPVPRPEAAAAPVDEPEPVDEPAAAEPEAGDPDDPR